jgi:hypothetical protein
VTAVEQREALRLEGLADVPCSARGGKTIVAGVMHERRCSLLDGHDGHDIEKYPHQWRWVATDEVLVDDIDIDLGDVS